MKKTVYIAALAALMTGLTLTGCKDDPTTTPPSGDALVKPKTGTTYTFATYQTDSLGAKVPGSDSTKTYTVVATDLTYAGKTNVYKLAPSGSDVEDTVYVRYEDNGDVSQYFASNDDMLEFGTWITVPFTTKTPQTKKALDTTVAFPGLGDIKLVVDITTSGSGSASSTVPAGTFNAMRGQVDVKITGTSGGLALISLNRTITLQFAPKIGYAVSVGEAGTASFFGSVERDGTSETLTSYTLQ